MTLGNGRFFFPLFFFALHLITATGVFQLTRCGLLWLAVRTFPTLSEPSGCPMLVWPLQKMRDSCAFIVINVCRHVGRICHAGCWVGLCNDDCRS